MARPGFVLEVDDRTPPLVVADGAGFRLERFPLDTRVVYPAESLPAIPDVAEAISSALDHPLDSEPLTALLRPGMKLTIAFDDISTPLPKMRLPDVRGRIIEAVLSRAAQAGVDDVTLVAARGLHRRMTDSELQHVLGERVFRSFFADGRLVSHDAEDPDQLTSVGETQSGPVRINPVRINPVRINPVTINPVTISAAAVHADLLVFVHLAGASGNGVSAVAKGLGSTSTIRLLAHQPETGAVAPESGDVEASVAAACRIFQVEAVLDNAELAAPLEFLGKREWEWNLKDQAAWLAVRHGLSATTAKTRRRIFGSVQSGYAAVQIAAGSPGAVAAASTSKVLAQRMVEVHGQADVAILGVPATTQFSVDSITNPVLAAWSALGKSFTSHRGRPVVRPGGALIVYHPMPVEFSSLHHPSFIDFFSEVLTTTTDPVQLSEKFEAKFAGDPWYTHLYRTSYAFHGVHPFHLWYEMAAARAHCGDILWVGACRTTVDRLGFRAASTLADALEIVSSTVGRAPSITYLHSSSLLITDVR